MPAAPQTVPATRTPAMTPAVVVVVLSLLLGIQPITTDLYLPSLPSLTESFGASVSQAQLTLITLLLAFGTSQLVWGPLSDRFGRRPVLLTGLAAYTLASIGCALAPSMTLLIVWRTVQGAAMGAAVMGARAIIRDLYSPEIGARVMANAMGGLGVIACLSPPLGGLIGEAFGWRWVLAGLALFGASALIEVLGLTRIEYGVLVFSMSFTYLLGTRVCRRLLPRYGVRRSVAIAGGLSVAGGTLLGLVALAGVRQPLLMILPYYLFILAHGIHQPCAQSGAVGPFPQAAGAASALNGFTSMVVAFGVGIWVGQRLDGTVFALTNGVWFWSVCLAVVAWTLVQQHGEPRRA